MKILSTMKSFDGVYTALVTPFLPDGSIDWTNYGRLLDRQIAAGITGVVPCGTTGETPTLSGDERIALISSALEKCRGKCQVIAGTGSNDTKIAVRQTQEACNLGVDGVLVVTPYYNKPSQRGLEEYFLSVANASSAPVIAYNVPGRTGVQIHPSTMANLAQHPSIAGIKEATGNLATLTLLRREVRKKIGSSKPFYFLSGDDPTFWPFLTGGGNGIISVASNIIPRNFRLIYEDWNQGRVGQGLALFEELFELLEGIFIESNPIPIKTLMSWQGLLSASWRSPLGPMQSSNESRLKQIWSELLPHLRQDLPREDLRA